MCTTKADSNFEALDKLNIAFTDLKATIALLSAVIVNEVEDDDVDLVGVIERHLRRDLAAVDAAEAEARAVVLGLPRS